MNTAIRVTRGLVGITGLIQLALGIVFWTGHAKTLIPFHMINGLLFVLALWTMAGLTARAGAPIPLVATTFVWGLILPAFGMAQINLLPGPWHWVIRVVHLLTGLVAMRLGDLLFRRARWSRGAGSPRMLEKTWREVERRATSVTAQSRGFHEDRQANRSLVSYGIMGPAAHRRPTDCSGADSLVASFPK